MDSAHTRNIGTVGLLSAAALALALTSCKKTPGLSKYRHTAPLVLVSIDTLRADRLPVYGYEAVRTPGIDRFAKDSVVFERCYSHCPLTLPSHANMLTGQLPFETGVRDNMGFSLGEDQETLAAILGRHGFRTGGFVSSFILRRETGIGKGFETYDSEIKRGKGKVAADDLQRDGAVTLASALDWLGGLPVSDRFFLFFHLYEPHSPYAPPEPYRTQYAGSLYDGEIARADELFGRFIDHQKGAGYYDRSLVVLTSDHGEALGDHGEREHGVFLYNEVIHVPLIIKFPGGVHAGRRIQTPVQLIDLLPTVLDFYAIGPPSGCRGRPLIGAFDAEPERVIYSESLFPLYHFGWSPLYCVTDAKYKYIKTPREEFYNVQRDPMERKNLAADLAAIAARYRRQVDLALARSSIVAPAEITEDEMEKLQALGYAGMAPASAVDGGRRPDAKDKIHLIEKLRRGLRLLRKGDEEGAVAAFGQLLSEGPDAVDIIEQLGHSLARLKRSHEASMVLHGAARLCQSNPVALVNVAQVFWRLARPDDALRYVKEALQLDQNLHAGFELKGQILHSTGDHAGAVSAMDRALALDPTLPMPYYIKGSIALQKGRRDEALHLFRRAQEESAKGEPRSVPPSLHLHIAALLEEKGETAEAISAYRKELAIRPANFVARIAFARLLVHLRRRNEAVALFDEPCAISPEARSAMSDFLKSIGEEERAARIPSDHAEGRLLLEPEP